MARKQIRGDGVIGATDELNYRRGGEQVEESRFVDGDAALHGSSIDNLYVGSTTTGIQIRRASRLATSSSVPDTPPVTKRSEPRDHRMMVRIPTSLHQALKRVAKEDERSMSDWIVVTLQEAIAKRDRKRR